MPTEVSREEFETRLGVLEREVEGEKMVTRHILAETRRNSDDLAAIKSRMDRLELRFDGLDRKVDGLERKVDGLDRKVDDLTKSLPRLIGEAMREAGKARSRKR